MRFINGTSVGIVALSSALCTVARAQEGSYLNQRVAAPSDALELKVSSAYTQGFGNVAPGRAVNQVAGAGIGVGGDIDYRLNPSWSLGIEGQYAGFADTSNNSSASGGALNFGGTYHFVPTLRGDPWLRLGTGYRWLYENGVNGVSGNNSLRHGFEALTAKVGYDVRVSKDVAIAPVLGADLNIFAWESHSGSGTTSSTTTTSSAEVATFVYLGVQGRFDIGGTRSGGYVAAVAPPAQVVAVAPPPPPPPVETTPVSPSIAVSDEVKQACLVDLGSVAKAPKFEFDKAELDSEDEAVLKKIAVCFTTGPMKDSSVHLVGRADPRGSLEYNDKLGERRAGNVAGFLEEEGVTPDKIEKESRGKRDATGTDDAGWSLDRRVDVVQGQ